MKNLKSRKGNLAVGIGTFGLLFTLIAAWLTHIIHCLLAAKYLLLIAGTIIAPIGVIHGIGLWFGVTW